MLYKMNGQGEIVSDIKQDKDKATVGVDKKIDAKTKKLQAINLFAKQVVEKMKKEEVLPSPANYLNYFEKMLLEKAPSQKESIEEILELESDTQIEREYIFKVDTYVNESFERTKHLLDDINHNYSKIKKIKNFIKTKGSELSKNLTPANLSAFDSKIDAALKTLENEQENIKESYLEFADVIKKFNKESIFDKKYGVYNKKYLFESIKNELDNLKNFEYKNCVISFCINKDVLKKIKLKSDKDIVIKTVSKIILDRSRRSDILAHYEDGIFLLVLKHTDFESAKRAVSSIKNFVSFSNFIIDATSIQAKINTSIVEMKADMSVDEVIGDCIKGLAK